MTEQELKDMGMHDTVIIYLGAFNINILRVYKGWIYVILDQEQQIRSTEFVPETTITQEHVEPRLK